MDTDRASILGFSSPKCSQQLGLLGQAKTSRQIYSRSLGFTPGSWFEPGPAFAVWAFRRVRQWMEDFAPSLTHTGGRDPVPAGITSLPWAEGISSKLELEKQSRLEIKPCEMGCGVPSTGLLLHPFITCPQILSILSHFPTSAHFQFSLSRFIYFY